MWSKCPECNYICTTTELRENLYVCPKCNYHHRIGSDDYFDILFDNGEYTALYDEITSKDFWVLPILSLTRKGSMKYIPKLI